jgi:zinc protease
VVGEFDRKELQDQVDSIFKGWLSSESYKRIEIPYQDLKPINIDINTPDKASSAMMVMLPIAVGDYDDDAAALELGAYIFGGGFLNSRLATRLRGKDGLCYNVSSWVSFASHESNGQFNGYAIFAPENTSAVELGVKEELDRALAKGFTVEELEAAKSGMLQKSRVDRAQNSALAGMLANDLFLERKIQWSKDFEERIKTLTLEEVNAAFKRHIKPEKLSFVKAGDASKVK